MYVYDEGGLKNTTLHCVNIAATSTTCLYESGFAAKLSKGYASRSPQKSKLQRVEEQEATSERAGLEGWCPSGMQ